MDSYQPGKRSRDDYEKVPEIGGFSQSSRDGFDNKRQHIDPAAELISNVCKDIRRIGENANILTQVDDISYISNPIVAEFEKIDKLRNAVLDTIYAVVIEQPQKISSLSVLVLLCNPKNFLVSKYVIEFFHFKAQQLLDSLFEKKDDLSEDKESTTKSSTNPFEQQEKEEFAGVFNNIKSILKFLAALSPIIQGTGVVDLFKQFLNLSIEIQEKSPSKRNGLAEEIFYNTLLALPYILSNDFSAASQQHCNELLEIATNFKYHDTSFKILEPFNKKGSKSNLNIPYEPKNIISLILPALQKLQTPEKDWSNLRNKLFIEFNELIEPIIAKSLENNPLGNENVKHQLPPLAFASADKFIQDYKPKGQIDTLWIKNPRILFQVYNIITKFETVPPIDSYIGIFFKDLAFDILTNMSFNKNEASIQLSILDLYFSKDLFTPPGSSIEQLNMIHEDNISGENNPPLSTWKIEDVAVESILTMIFQLPVSLHVEVYYYSVLISCCRESPDSIAPVFGRAIRFFYNNLESLDYELKIRFLDWMSIQISNFEFSWKWDEWVKDSKIYKNLNYHPKKNFIKNLIAKEIRLSNKKRIKESFVTVDPESGNLVHLEEFYQYLNLSLVSDEEQFILDYDTELYGNTPDIKELFVKLANERRDKKMNMARDNLSLSPQDEIVYNFSLPSVPLNEIANTVYDFIVANFKSNNDFQDLCQGVLNAVETNLDPSVNKDRFLINLIFQTYVFIGSRSIFSAVSVFSRDITKLKYLAGWQLKEEDYEQDHSGFRFKDLQLTTEEFDIRQEWIIEAVLRVWNHQPQVAFLILEYLIDFKIIKAIKLIEKAFEIDSNLIIVNVSCMESINRIISNLAQQEKISKVEEAGDKNQSVMAVEQVQEEKQQSQSEEEQQQDEKPQEQQQEEKQDESTMNDNGKMDKAAEIPTSESDSSILMTIFRLIVTNLNKISTELGVDPETEVQISQIEEEDVENLAKMKTVDSEWLFYEYLGFLKSYLRRYYGDIINKDNVKHLFNDLVNVPIRNQVFEWFEELNE